MYRRILGAVLVSLTLTLLAGLLGLVGGPQGEPSKATSLGAVAPTQEAVKAAPPWELAGKLDCYTVRDKDRSTFSRNDPRGGTRSRDVYVSATARGRHCIGRTGYHWIEPVAYTVRGDFTGSRINCNSWQNFWQGLKWQMSLNDGRGTYYKGLNYTTDCDEDTYITWTFSLASAPILYYCDIRPTWQVRVTLQLWGTRDPHRILNGPFWGFTGPVRQRCF